MRRYLICQNGEFSWTNVLEKIDLIRAQNGVYDFLIDSVGALIFDRETNGWIQMPYKDNEQEG